MKRWLQSYYVIKSSHIILAFQMLLKPYQSLASAPQLSIFIAYRPVYFEPRLNYVIIKSSHIILYSAPVELFGYLYILSHYMRFDNAILYYLEYVRAGQLSKQYLCVRDFTYMALKKCLFPG